MIKLVTMDKSLIYNPTAVKKMTILVPGPIYVEYSDIVDIITHLIQRTGNQSVRNFYFFVAARSNACDFFIYHTADQIPYYENHP
jgi:hypothetical protein